MSYSDDPDYRPANTKVFDCDMCENPINEGDDYFDFGNNLNFVCYSCAKLYFWSCRRTAEKEGRH